MALLSNTGSLFYGLKENQFIFASENSFLKSTDVSNISKLKGIKIIDIPSSKKDFNIQEINISRSNLVPSFTKEVSQKKELIFEESNLRRCNKCILLETMPFIKFNKSGICNYCENYINKFSKT